MKKILSLSLVALMTLSATAQVQQVSSVQPINSSAKNNTEVKVATMDNSIVRTASPRRVVAAESDVLGYLRPQGGFFVGVSSDFGSFYPRIVVDEVEFSLINYSQLSSKDSLFWFLPTTQGTYYEDAWDYLTKTPLDFEMDVIEAGYGISSPILATVPTLESEMNNAYQWGGLYSNNSMIISKPDFTFPLTTCAMYSGDDNDMYMVGADPYGEFAYGSNLKIEFSDEPGVIYIPDTIVIVFDNLTTLWMDSLTLPIYNRSANSVADMIPAGAEIKFDILNVKLEDNTYKIGDVITSTSATQADLVADAFSDGKGLLGVLNAAFGSTNALGGFTPQPLTITGMFAVQISGFSSNGCNFGMYCDFDYPVGQTYYHFADMYTSLWKGGGNNVALSINAMFVDPEEGGETGVENINAVNGVEKVVVDGQVLIRKGDKTYNVLGAEVK